MIKKEDPMINYGDMPIRVNQETRYDRKIMKEVNFLASSYQSSSHLASNTPP